jgi:hypothetical protein
MPSRSATNVTVKLSGGRLVDAEIKAIIETAGGVVERLR